MSVKKKISFPKSARLLKSKQFRYITKHGEEKVGSLLVMQILSSRKNESGAKLGITISKKFGKAFARNRVKRQIREAFRLQRASFPSNLLLHVRPRKKALKAKRAFFENELLQLFFSIKTQSSDY